MSRFYTEPAALAYTAQNRTAVLLLNLGTPDAPTAAAVKPYLKEFLSDQRVVELPKLLWQPILRGLVLTFRPKKSAHAYEKVWFKEGSPLEVYTHRQAEALAKHLPDVIVRHAMTYGNSPRRGQIAGHPALSAICRLFYRRGFGQSVSRVIAATQPNERPHCLPLLRRCCLYPSHEAAH